MDQWKIKLFQGKMNPKFPDLLPRPEDGLLTTGSALAVTGGGGGTGVEVPDDLCVLMAN